MTVIVRGQLMHIITDRSSRVITIAEQTLRAPLHRLRRARAQEYLSARLAAVALLRTERSVRGQLPAADQVRLIGTAHRAAVRAGRLRAALHQLPSEVPYV